MTIEGISEPILKKFEVCFNAEKVEVQCICRSFEFRGILCNHAICVLDNNDVTKLPSQYIIQRWRKDFKSLHSLERSLEVGVFACAPIDRYDDIYTHCHEIAEIGSMSDMKYKLALNAIKKVKDELLAFNEENPDNNPNGSIDETNTTKIIDPIKVMRKGRPSELRLQSTVEKVGNAKRKKIRNNPKNKSNSVHDTNNNQQLPVGEVNNINQCDVSFIQPSIQIGQQVNPFTGTQENIVEQSELIRSQVGVQSSISNPPYSFVPMGHQGNC